MDEKQQNLESKMCGRFYVDEDGDITPWIEEANRKQMMLTGEMTVHAGEILPSSAVAAVARGKKEARGVFPMIWGYQSTGDKKLLINARSETASARPLFRDSLRERRCLLPADHYFEWEHPENGKKVKYQIRPEMPGTVWLAALYRFMPDRILPQCIILTREPEEEIRFIHNRMPLIFNDEEAESWLRQDADPEKLIRENHRKMKWMADAGTLISTPWVE